LASRPLAYAMVDPISNPYNIEEERTSVCSNQIRIKERKMG
jgi:hypothetical protein